MSIDVKLLVTFIEIIAFFGLLGWAVDMWVRSKQAYLYPVYGMIAFALLDVPMTYLANGYHAMFTWIVAIVIVGFGLVGVSRYGLLRSGKAHWNLQNVLIIVFALGLVLLYIIQASKYAIPGGIDSAIHSSIIQGVVATAALPGTYPLGMHITIFSLENLFHAQQEQVFLSLYMLLSISTLTAMAFIADRMTKRPLAGFIALAVGSIDVSLFNNYLNGSGTHLVGIAFSAWLILIAVVLEKTKRFVRILGIAAVLTVIWYFHYPTIFFSLPLLWAWRLSTRQRNSWEFILAFGMSLVMSIPLQFKLLHDPSYVTLLVPGLSGLLLIEFMLKFFGQWLQKILSNRLSLGILAIISAWLFTHYSTAFLYIPTWYGVTIIRLALVGLFAAVLNRRPLSVFALLSFAMMSILHAVVQLPPLVSHTKVMIELFYYYGFTCSLILLGIAGADELKQLIQSRRWRQLAVGFVAMYSLLVVASRSFDKPLIGAILRDDKPISRYESSKGFGVFYTKNDADLASWVKQNVPKEGIIANPGGLYNSWAPLTEHPTLWATYNVPTVAEPEQYITNIKKLLRGESDVDIDLLLRRGIKYILVPEQYSVAIYNSRVQLVKQMGRARFYRFSPVTTANWLTIPLGDGSSKDGLAIITSGHYACRYCGNTFYFTEQSTLQNLTLRPNDTMSVIFPLVRASEGLRSLSVDYELGGLEIRWGNGQWKSVNSEENSQPIETRGLSSNSIEIRNASENNVVIRAIGLRSL